MKREFDKEFSEKIAKAFVGFASVCVMLLVGVAVVKIASWIWLW